MRVFVVPESNDRVFAALENTLPQLLASDEVNHIIAIVNGTSRLGLDNQVALIEGSLPLFTDANEIISSWFEEVESTQISPVQKARAVLAASLPQLQRATREELIVQSFTLSLDLDRAVVELLLRRPMATSESNETYLDIFLEAHVNIDIVSINEQHSAYRWLHKIAIFY